MTSPYGPPSGPHPQQQPVPPGYGPPSGPVPQQVPPQPYGMPGYPMQQPVAHGRFAEWGTRVVGYLIDAGISLGAFLLALLVASLFVAAGAGMVGGLIGLLLYLGAAAYGIWNLVYRRGTTGSTVGQKAMKIATVGEDHGRPIGFGNAFLRQLCHVLDSIPFNIGFLAPLWEVKHQTWADRIMRTVVVHVDQPAPGMPPAAGPAGGYAPQVPVYGVPQTPGHGSPQQYPAPPQQYGPPQQPPMPPQQYGPPPQQW